MVCKTSLKMPDSYNDYTTRVYRISLLGTLSYICSYIDLIVPGDQFTNYVVISINLHVLFYCFICSFK